MKDNTQEAAFSLEQGDKFKCIIASDPVKYAEAPDHETVITFLVIRRHTGLYDIVNVTKTFKGSECVSRNVQIKPDITAERIDIEVANIRKVFAMAIADATALVLTWNTLDLTHVMSIRSQVKRIQAWGRVAASVVPDIPPQCLN